MTKLLMTAAAVALLSATAASAAEKPMAQPGQADAIKDKQAGCPAGTTEENCKGGSEEGRSSTTQTDSGNSVNGGNGGTTTGGEKTGLPH